MIRSATFSRCGRYRYHLIRQWGTTLDPQTVLFVMLNPSTADEIVDDPTIRRCIVFAKRWGFNRLEVCNLFALRATDPRELYGFDVDPIGPDNNRWIDLAASHATLIVCAWGAHGIHRGRGAIMETRLRTIVAPALVRCFGVTKRGEPKHPLYLPDAAELAPLRRSAGVHVA